ncbi:ATP-binding protein [Lentzea sp.]|uniref:ATP-binding protein n=1 Tax=Lentzea sp. TaxID=56099 RepID=UPI002C5C22F2|nr:ATP-binding protein [Lentzea sp.]HUQ61495.1 ATP-binding protein [Lentzea sp.]
MLINASLRDVGLAGRTAELAVLDRVLSGAVDAPHVVHLHGPGGIGKSALLRHTARQARLDGREVAHVDARFLNADPRRLEEAAAPACVEPGAVVLVDAFERCRQLEPWLRDTFLPRLAAGAVVVLASRTAPDAEWSLDPEWTRRFTRLDVRPLDAAASDALLAARGVTPDQRGAIVSFAGGSPLVLTLAASAPAAHWKPTGDLLTTLVERLVGDLPSPVHRRGLDVLAQARVTRESLLRAVLGDEDASTVFAWLRRQPYVEATPDGLLPHDAVRSVLDADLRWRDPERHEDVRTRISVTCLDAVRRATEDDALRRVAEWMFLFRDQDGSHDPHSDIVDTRLEPGDVPEVLRMAEGPAVAHWIRHQPQGFRVYRSAGALVGFMAILRLDAPSPEDLAADPVIAALWEQVEAVAPLRRGEHLGIRRFAVQSGGHQRPSPLMDLIDRRTVAAEMRASGRAMTFTVFQDAGRRRHHLTAGMHEVVVVDRQHVFGRDWRRQPVEQWVEHRARAAAPAVAWAPGPPNRLPRNAFEEGVLEALRTWRAPREFATSVLLRSHLVPPGSADPVTDLRDAITAALDALRVDPAGVKAHDALTATYVSGSGTHKATARRLGVPYGTYRRHLALARERLVEHLLAR